MIHPLCCMLALVVSMPAQETFDRFAEWARSVLPQRGSLVLCYANTRVTGQVTWVGFDFGSGAAFMITDGRVMGIDPEGNHFKGLGYKDQVRFIPAETSLGDLLLDYLIPAVYLRGLTRARDHFVSAERTAEGGWKATFRFVEGRRGFRPENLPGGASFPRETSLCFVTLAPDGTVLEIRRDRPGWPPWTFEPATERPGGIPVSAAAGDSVLVHSEFIPEGDRSRFTLPAVEKFAIEARTDAYRSIQQIDTGAPPPAGLKGPLTPQAPPHVRWSRGIIIGGSALIVAGAAWWWLRRRAGA